jgi:hypothetical protein
MFIWFFSLFWCEELAPSVLDTPCINLVYCILVKLFEYICRPCRHVLSDLIECDIYMVKTYVHMYVYNYLSWAECSLGKQIMIQSNNYPLFVEREIHYHAKSSTSLVSLCHIISHYVLNMYFDNVLPSRCTTSKWHISPYVNICVQVSHFL